MRCKKLLIRSWIFLLCVISLSACLQAAAGETTLRSEYKKITENGFVADVFMGVEARYNLNGPTIYCTELIPRFVREVYGVKIAVRGDAPVVIDDSGCRFAEVEYAEPGDVLIAVAGARGKSYNHWAICKAVDYEEEEMTLFEQNWRWNGCACVDRVIPLNGSCYRAFRLVTDEGPLPTLAVRAELEAAKEAAEKAAREAAEKVAQDAAMQAELSEQPVVQSQNLLRQAIRSAELIL